MASPSNFYLIPVHPLPSILCVPFYLLSFISSFSFKPIHIIIGALESGSFSPLLPMPLVLAFWLKKSSSFPLFFHFLSPCSSDHWQYYPLSLSTPFSITTYFPHAVSGQCDIHSPPLNITTVHSLPRCQGKGKDNSLKCLSPGSYSGYLPRARPCNRPEDKEMWNPWKLGKGRKDMGDKKEEKERERGRIIKPTLLKFPYQPRQYRQPCFFTSDVSFTGPSAVALKLFDWDTLIQTFYTVAQVKF